MPVKFDAQGEVGIPGARLRPFVEKTGKNQI